MPGELPGFVEGDTEAADLVHEAALQRLGAGPHSSPGYLFQVVGSHAPARRDAVLEPVVEGVELVFEDGEFVRGRRAARVEEVGAGAAFDGDRVDLQLAEEAGGYGAGEDHAYRPGYGVLAGDHVVRRSRDVVAARGRRVPHEDDDRLSGTDTQDLAPDQVGGERVAARGVHVEQDRADPAALLGDAERRHDRVAPGLLPPEQGQRYRELAALSPPYRPLDAY